MELNSEKAGPEHSTSLASPRQPARKCHCRNSQCIKLYCECFRNEQFCNGCECERCLNSPETIQRGPPRDPISLLNWSPAEPDAQTLPRPEHEPTPLITLDESGPKAKPQSCNCRNSFCRKKYCECFQEGRLCSSSCRCTRCKNTAAVGQPEEKKEGTIWPRYSQTREELRAKLLIRLLEIRNYLFSSSN